MKLTKLLLYLVVVVLFVGCKNEKAVSTPGKKNNAVALKKNSSKSPKKAAKIKPYKLKGLSKTNKSVRMGIDKINNKKLTGKLNVKLDQKAKQFAIQGWALDGPNVAKDVLVSINGVNYKAKYGQPRSDIAKKFKSDNLLNCGFVYSLPISYLKKGENKIGFKILSKKSKSYAVSKRVVKVFRK